jgi:broad specificity phosphatase PhoE
MAVEIVYETHSISEDNERGIATGWLPGRLSPEGRRLAAQLGERRRGERFVYVSDLGRAVETAEIAFGGTDAEIRQDARLREVDYGAWNGAPVARIEGERRRHIDEPFPGGQSYEDVVEQMRGFLADLRREHEGGRVVVIGHSATRWALQHLLEGTPLEELVDAPFAWQEGWEFRA